MKIHSPVEGYTDRTEIGPFVLEFVDGVADYDEDKHEPLNDGVKAYLKDLGYGLGSRGAKTPDSPPEPPDPREVGENQVGTRTRDGAVDPREGDFLAPTNAGQANPHGSSVVSPEIHASEGVRPVKPGDVHVDDAAAQDKAELQHAAAATDGTPIDDAKVYGDSVDLKGAALDDALEDAGLSKSGTADEKRDRLAEHQAKA